MISFVNPGKISTHYVKLTGCCLSVVGLAVILVPRASVNEKSVSRMLPIMLEAQVILNFLSRIRKHA